jgi:hypothetical protein
MIRSKDALIFKPFVAVCFMCSALISNGQDKVVNVPRHAIKFSPLHALNLEVGSIQLAYEYRFSPKFSVQLEGGYVFGDVWWSYASADATGYKLKEDFRWYFTNKEVTKTTGRKIYKGLYLSMELHQNRMKFVSDGYELYRQNGMGLKTGFVRYSAWGFMFDVNAGFSLARTNIEPLGIPLNNYQPGRNGYVVLLPIVGVRVGKWIR